MDNNQLEILLRQLETDRPPEDFSDSIMEMIDASAFATETSLTLSTKKTRDRAPMHMTDLVMNSIAPSSKKESKIINISEIRNLAIALTITLLISWIAAPKELIIQTDSHWVSIAGHIPGAVIVAAVVGSILWIVDYLLRQRMVRVGK